MATELTPCELAAALAPMATALAVTENAVLPLTAMVIAPLAVAIATLLVPLDIELDEPPAEMPVSKLPLPMK